MSGQKYSRYTTRKRAAFVTLPRATSARNEQRKADNCLGAVRKLTTFKCDNVPNPSELTVLPSLITCFSTLKTERVLIKLKLKGYVLKRSKTYLISLLKLG